MALDCVKFFVFICLYISFDNVSGLKKEDCEVCFTVIEKFSSTLTSEMKEDKRKIEQEFKKFCKTAVGRDHQFCYYLGGLEMSATGILSEMSRPLQVSMPPSVICKKLQRLDGQICELRYEKTIDFKNVDLMKLKVKDLKRILANWGEDCEGCIEKIDFVNRITELQPKYVRDEL